MWNYTCRQQDSKNSKPSLVTIEKDFLVSANQNRLILFIYSFCPSANSYLSTAIFKISVKILFLSVLLFYICKVQLLEYMCVI